MVRARAKGTLPFRILSAAVALTFVMSMATVGYSIPPAAASDPSLVQTVATDASDAPAAPDAAASQPEGDAAEEPAAEEPKAEAPAPTAKVAGQTAVVAAAPATVDVKSKTWEQLQTLPGPDWINGNLNQNNSKYYEGMSTPQRLILDYNSAGTATTNHSVTFQYGYTKAGKHAYDFLTSWDQAKATASAIGQQSFQDAWRWIDYVPADFINNHATGSMPDGGQAGSKITAYENLYGDRIVDVFGNAPVGNVTVTMGSFSGSIAGDSEQQITVSWTGAATQVMVLFGGHIAVSSDPEGTGIGWGPGSGASAISGSPYHIALVSSTDWTGGASMDNQLQASGVYLRSGVTGTKWLDVNGNGVRDAGDTGLSGWTIYDDQNGNSVLDAGEPSAVTTASGGYALYKYLTVGSSMTVREVQKPGYVQTYPSGLFYTTSLAPGDNLTGFDFGNHEIPGPDISVTKSPNPSSVPETGGDVTYSFVVKNNNTEETVTITSVVDDKFGNLSSAAGVPFMLAPGASKSFSITRPVAGDAGTSHENTVTVIGSNTRGQSDTATAHAVVTFTDVLPTIDVQKQVSPGSLAEPGGPFYYTISVTNTSLEPVTIDSFTDLLPGGVLSNAPAGAVGTVLAPGGSYTWSPQHIYTEFGTYLNVASATAHDNENNTASDQATQTVYVTNTMPDIAVSKTPNVSSVPETGGDVVYTIVVTNNSVETLTVSSVVDDKFGDLSAVAGVPFDLAAAGGSKTFTITRNISGEAGTSHTNIVTAVGHDNENNTDTATDDAVVAFTDVLPDISVSKTPNVSAVPETGGDVVYTIVVTNNAIEDVEITSVVDDKFGNLDTDAGVPFTLAAGGGSKTFTITRHIVGEAFTSHVNVVTATGADNDGNTDTASDNATVTFTDVLPTVKIEKLVTPSLLPEPGGLFSYTIRVTNTSPEPITIDSLTDTLPGGTVLTNGPAAGVVLQPNATYEWNPAFTYTEANTYLDTARVSAHDNEMNPCSDEASVSVTVTDELPDISIVKTASPTTVPETGGDVEFTYVIHNNADEAVEITSVSDDKFDLTGAVSVPFTIAANGSSAPFTITRHLTGEAHGTHVNVVTAVGHDNEGNTDTATDDATVTFSDVMPDITVSKSPSPSTLPETGGNVTYTIVVTNNAAEAVQITSVVDDKFGNLNTEAGVPFSLAADGGSKTFTITRPLTGNAGTSHVNVVTAIGADNDGNTDMASDNATVTFADVQPDISVSKTPNVSNVPETGGDVVYTIVVTNNAAEAVQITSVVDDKFGNLSTEAGVPFSLAADGGSKTFTITRHIVGEANTSHVNVVTATGADNDGNTDTASDNATVTFTDVLPTIDVEKFVTPDSLAEPGGTFHYTIRVTNTSPEPVTITSLTDLLPGAVLDPAPAPAVGTVLQPGASYVWSPDHIYTEFGPYTNLASASAVDNEGNVATDSATKTVLVTDSLPDIAVTKTPSVNSVPETGGDVTYTFVVTNNSVEAVEITSVTDDKFGDLSSAAGVPFSLPALGGSKTFTLVKHLSGNAGTSHVNVVTVSGHDNEGNTDLASDDATVAFADVQPDIAVTKTPSVNSVPETGGDVVYTFVVTNNSLEDVEISSVVDDKFGDLSVAAGVPFTLAFNASKTFEITKHLDGPANTSHVNVVTVSGHDNDGNTDTATDDATVRFTDVLPTIDVEKSVTPGSLPEPGGVFHYTITVRNTSTVPVTITQLSDLLPGGVVDPAPAGAIGTVLAPNELFSWTPDHTYTEFGAYLNVASATAVDADGNPATDSANQLVNVTDSLPDIAVTKTPNVSSVPETGGDVTYTFVITNNSVESVEVTSVVDDKFGDLGSAAGVPFSLGANGDSKSFTITKHLSGEANTSHVNVVTVAAHDNEGNVDTAADDATVAFTDVLPTVKIEKVVTPLSLAEPGGLFSYTITVTNTSPEALTIDSLTDTLPDNTVLARAEAVGVVLQPNETYQWQPGFTYTEAATYMDTARVTAHDNELNPASDQASASVIVTDVLPDISVTKTPDKTVVLSGENVTFTFFVMNNSVESVTVTSVVDNVFGDLAVDAGVPFTLGPNQGKTFSITRPIAGTASHVNTVTVVAHDNENNADTATASATVRIVRPAIQVLKTSDAPEEGIENSSTVTYTYAVTNTGDVPLTNVDLVDDKLGDIALDLTLAVGETKTFTKSTQLFESTLNVVTATGQDEWGHSVSDTDDEDVLTFVPFTPPNLEIVKDADPVDALPGEVVTYTLRFRNLSEGGAQGITIVDDFDEDLMTVVDANGGTVSNGKITWHLFDDVALLDTDGWQTLTYTLKIDEELPAKTTRIDNVVVITVADDSDTSNNTDDARVTVGFLPFTGGAFPDPTAALIAAFGAVALLVGLRRSRREED